MKTINTTLFKLTEFDYTLDELFKFITGTYKIATLHGATYDDIVRHFGEPSIYYNTMNTSDGKVHVEWVFEYRGNPFTIYDWKTFNRDYTLQELDRWSIGGNGLDNQFFDALQNEFAPKPVTIIT